MCERGPRDPFLIQEEYCSLSLGRSVCCPSSVCPRPRNTQVPHLHVGGLGTPCGLQGGFLWHYQHGAWPTVLPNLTDLATLFRLSGELVRCGWCFILRGTWVWLGKGVDGVLCPS